MFSQIGNSLASSIFALCAILGGGLFIVQLLLRFIGVPGGDNLPDGSEISDLPDSDLSFKWLSLQGITVFFTMFGLVGLAVVQEKNQDLLALLLATLAGIVSVWIIQKIFQWVGGLQSRGNLDIQQAVGLEGSVYLTIPPQAQGQVELTIQNRHKVMDAISEIDHPIQTGQRVRVIRIINDRMLVVTPITDAK